MKLLNNFSLVLFIIFGSGFLSAQQVSAQTIYRQTQDSQLAITGTSTLRDWTMISSDGKYQGEFVFNQEGKLEKLSSFTFVIRFESLKSSSNALDKNAYITMETEVHKMVSFKLTSAVIGPQKIHCFGNLTIASTTNPIDLDVSYQLSNNRSLICTGSKTLKMSEYKIDPPVFMFGTVKTGDEINISFNVNLTPSSN